MKQEEWELKERKLFSPLRDWLKENGYSIYTEILNVDVIAKRDNDFIGFELKTSCSDKVIEQAYRAMTLCGRAYVVTPCTPREYSINKCKQRGVGIIKINNEIKTILDPNIFEHRLIDYYFKNYDFNVIPEGNEAGIPNMKGMGIAQRLLIEIKEYIKIHPLATWKEIFNNVPNHYSNHNSLANSMRIWQHFTLH